MDKRSRAAISFIMLMIVAFGFQAAYAQPFTDPTGDVFDANGKLAKAEPYLDIVSVDLKKSNANYVFEIGVNGTLPRSIDPSLWIEWDILIDYDNNPSTGWNSPLLFNDLGVDYVLRVGILNSTYYAELRQTTPWKLIGIPVCQISGSKITLVDSFLPSSLSWMAVVRKYGQKGAPNAPLLAADKAPNTGHYTTAIETIRTETAMTTLQEGNWTVLSDKTFDLIGEHGETGVDLGQPYVDLTSFSYSLSNQSLYFRFTMRDKIPDEPTSSRVDSIWYQVLLDVDSDSSTGFHWSNDFTPDYILQFYVKFASSKTANASSYVLKYAGNGGDWNWTEIVSTQRLGKDATLTGGIGEDFFVLACKHEDISASVGSTIRFFGRSGILYGGEVYNDPVPDWGTVTLTLLPSVTTTTTSTAPVATSSMTGASITSTSQTLVATTSLPAQVTLFQTSWPYLLLAFVIVAIGIILLARRPRKAA